MLIGFEWITAAAALPLDGNVIHRIIRRQRITVTVIGAASLIQAQGYDLTEFGKIPLRPLLPYFEKNKRLLKRKALRQ